MMKFVCILVIATLMCCIPLQGKTEAEVSTLMSDAQLRTIKNQLKQRAVETAWALSGYDTKFQHTHCLVNRTVYVFSKPELVKPWLLQANVVELSFSAQANRISECRSLVGMKELHLMAGRFITSESEGKEIIDKRDVNQFFIIQGEITSRQLLQLRYVIDEARKCIAASVACNSIEMTVRLPETDHYRMKAIRNTNIRSIEKQISPNDDGPYVILFRPYIGTELIVFISKLKEKRPTVYITRLIQ